MRAPLHATIVSVAPFVTLDHHHQLGHYVIPAKEADKPYASLVVWDRYAPKDYGNNKIEREMVNAEDLADDLIGVHREDDLRKVGVFRSAGDEPTEEELKEATARLEEYLRRCVAEAAASWDRFHDRRKIGDHALAAARYFGLKVEWAVDMREMVPCAACQELIAPSAVKCGKCGAIRDWERAREMGLVTVDQYEFGTGKSRVKTTAKVPASL